MTLDDGCIGTKKAIKKMQESDQLFTTFSSIQDLGLDRRYLLIYISYIKYVSNENHQLLVTLQSHVQSKFCGNPQLPFTNQWLSQKVPH